MGKPALADLPHWPRLLSLVEAARYVGLSTEMFNRRIGKPWPKPIRMGQRVLFDRDAIDRAVDGLTKSAAESPDETMEGVLDDEVRQIEAR